MAASTWSAPPTSAAPHRRQRRILEALALTEHGCVAAPSHRLRRLVAPLPSSGHGFIASNACVVGIDAATDDAEWERCLPRARASSPSTPASWAQRRRRTPPRGGAGVVALVRIAFNACVADAAPPPPPPRRPRRRVEALPASAGPSVAITPASPSPSRSRPPPRGNAGGVGHRGGIAVPRHSEDGSTIRRPAYRNAATAQRDEAPRAAG
jgi:hypothetical protein